MKSLIIVLVSLSLYGWATIGYYTGEQISGLSKICFYSTPKGTMTINIDNYRLCPMTMEFE